MLSVFSFFAYFMKIFDRQNMLIFFKIFNHRWRSLTWLHRCFWAQTNFFVKFIYKTPRKHLQNPWHSYHNFWHGFWTFQAICLLSTSIFCHFSVEIFVLSYHFPAAFLPLSSFQNVLPSLFNISSTSSQLVILSQREYQMMRWMTLQKLLKFY